MDNNNRHGYGSYYDDERPPYVTFKDWLVTFLILLVPTLFKALGFNALVALSSLVVIGIIVFWAKTSINETKRNFAIALIIFSLASAAIVFIGIMFVFSLLPSFMR